MSRRQMIYLHGFASSPQSTKAKWLTSRARAIECLLVCPDLNGDDFEGLTVTRMLEHVVGTMDALPDGPVVLVGSSLGALVALFAAVRCAGTAGAGAIRSNRSCSSRRHRPRRAWPSLRPARMAEWRRAAASRCSTTRRTACVWGLASSRTPNGRRLRRAGRDADAGLSGHARRHGRRRHGGAVGRRVPTSICG